jgi:hypothetical protein
LFPLAGDLSATVIFGDIESLISDRPPKLIRRFDIELGPTISADSAE